MEIKNDRRQLSYSEIYGCSLDLGAHYCDPCLDEREYGRARSGGYIKKSYLDTLLTDPTDLAAWTDGIAGGNIIMIPETSGSYEPGDPKELKGYGDRSVTYGTRGMTLTLFDPNYVSNYPFYNAITRQSDLVPFFRTSSLVHIFDTVATIVAKDPVADDLEAEVVWEVTNKVTSANIPAKYPIASIASIFVCNYVAP